MTNLIKDLFDWIGEHRSLQFLVYCGFRIYSTCRSLYSPIAKKNDWRISIINWIGGWGIFTLALITAKYWITIMAGLLIWFGVHQLKKETKAVFY